MAILKQELRTLLISVTDLTDLVGTRVFPLWTSTITDRPFIVMETTAKKETNHLRGDSYFHVENVSLSITADTQLVAENISTVIRRMLSGLQSIAVNDIYFSSIILVNTSDTIQSPADGSEDQRYIITQDFDVTYFDATDAPIVVADIP